MEYYIQAWLVFIEASGTPWASNRLRSPFQYIPKDDEKCAH